MTKPISLIHYRKQQENNKRGWSRSYIDRNITVFQYDTTNHLWWLVLNTTPLKHLYSRVVNTLLRPYWPLHQKFVDSMWPYRLHKLWLFLTFRYAPYYVNVYEVDRAYGGPEEGGWWYDTGVPFKGAFGKASFKCWTRARADALAQKLREQIEQPETYIENPNPFKFGKWVPHINRYSVIGGGDIEVHVDELPAREYPQHRPYYC